MSQISKALGLGLLLIFLVTAMSGCSEENFDQDNGVTAQGTVDLGTIKLGTADQVFQEAVVTFVRDQCAAANAGGKRQYLSRTDLQGGQYVAQVKDGSCFEIAIRYKAKPVSREAAEIAMKKLLPDGAPPQSRVDEASLTQAPSGPNQHYAAIYYFGDDYLGDLSFTDKSARHVTELKVSNILLFRQAQADSLAQKEGLKPQVEKAEEHTQTPGH